MDTVKISSKEQIYDELIAPKLLEIGKLCEQHGISLVSVCEYEPNNLASTSTLQECAGDQIKNIYALNQSGRNIDSFFLHIMRIAEKTGHSSLILNRLGVAEKPVTKKVTGL